MKRTLLLLIIAIPMLLLAQTLPTQIQRYEWRTDLFDWVLVEGYSFQYDERDSVRREDRFSNWFGPSRTIQTFDEQGRMLLSQGFGLGQNQLWESSHRTTFTYDTDGNSQESAERKQNGQWSAYLKITVLTTEMEDWVETQRNSSSFDRDNQTWVNSAQITERKRRDGLQLMYQRLEWQNGQWEESSFSRYEYDAQDNPTLYEFRYQSSVPFTQFRWRYEYDENLQIVEELEDRRGNESAPWRPYQRIRYEYDEQGRETLQQEYFYSTARHRRYETAYRGDTIIQAYYRTFGNDPFEGFWRRYSVYHERENMPLLFQRNDRWENGQWELGTTYRRSLEFNDRDHLVRVEEEVLEDGQWIAESYTNYTWQYRDDDLPVSKASVQYNYRTQQQRPMEKKIWHYEDRPKRSARPLIELFPNPSAGPLSVSFHSGPVLPIAWQVLDQKGAIVRQGTIDAAAQQLGLVLLIDDLQAGLYLLQIQYEDGSTVAKKWQRN
ncbi:MAG: T9SS type A sorting domain-containing protein [Bacteroidota bacterium]